MKVAILCEFTGTVRDAFIKRGHDAVSFDLMDTESPGPHVIGDIQHQDLTPFDLIIAHPPCTHLAICGARWFHLKRDEQADALEFVRWIMTLHNPMIAIENPISIISSHIRKPDQIIHPWQFGHGEKKATCLWLKGLPGLIPTDVVPGRIPRMHRMGETKDRWKKRSKTYQGIADAMAEQWGTYALNNGTTKINAGLFDDDENNP